MRTTEIARVFEAPGPFLTLYLATPGDVENAAQRVELRWKNARGDLLQQGVPESLLAAVDPLVEGSHLAGATLALIASVDGVLWSANLADPPPREVLARWAALPSLVPLLAHEQSQVPYVAVLASRGAAELVAQTPEGDRGAPVVVEGEQSPHLTRSAPGGWSQPRYQHRAEVVWERNAAEVAEALSEVVDRVRPRLVAVAGDVRAVQLLREQSPKRVAALVQEVGGELGSIEAVLERAGELVRATVERDTRELLDRFEEERGQHDRAAEGLAETVAALTRAQVEVLLLVDRLDDQRTAWFGEAPEHVALDRETLLAAGAVTPAEGRLVDVAVRTALTTGATVRVLDQDDQRAPADGLGALLRFATP
jgi:Bacterial archaeo-eukaryotic release factor family 2